MTSTLIRDTGLLELLVSNPDSVVPEQGPDFKMADAATRADIVACLMTLKASK